MALNTVTLLTLIQKLAEANSDYLSFSTTTTVTTDNYVISTTLGQYDESEDDHFGGADTEWWLYIDGVANSDILRRTSDYSAASTRITVEGAALVCESAAVTCRLYRFNRDHMVNAIEQACEEVYPALYLPLEDLTLITGNILSDASFEDWSSTSTLAHYSALSGTLAQATAAGSTRNGTYAVKYTAGATPDYLYISSKDYPRLLDLQDMTCDWDVWVYPEILNSAAMTIYTINAAGSTQTLVTTTACPAAKWSRIYIESQKLNDNLHELQVRFNVATDTKYAIFDDAMIQGRRMYEYLMPPNFRDGNLDSVTLQTSGNYDPACYDLHPFSTINPGRDLHFDEINNGTQRYVAFDQTLPTERRLRLLGNKPLEITGTDDTDTITIDAHRVPLFIAKAREIFWAREAVPISSKDKWMFKDEEARAARDYRRLLRLRMPMKPVRM